MKYFDNKYSKGSWTGVAISDTTGNNVVITSNAHIVCEMVQPVLIEGQETDFKIKATEQQANELLIRHTPALLERLQELYIRLSQVKSGEIPIFSFDIGTEIELTETVLTRATKID